MIPRSPQNGNDRGSAAFAGLVFMLGMAFLQLTNWSNNRHYEEITQKINKCLAMYIAQFEPHIENQKFNFYAIKGLADLVMVVNPIAEIYLLDLSGKILAHSLSKKTLHEKVNSVLQYTSYFCEPGERFSRTHQWVEPPTFSKRQ